VSIRYSKIQFT